MVRKGYSPSELQIRVLKWIHDGCPEDVVWEKHRERIAARVLANEGLAAVEGQGPTWRASLTAAGRDWLEPNVFAKERMAAEATALFTKVADIGGTWIVDRTRDATRYGALVEAANELPLRPRGQELVIYRVGSYSSPISAISLTPKWSEISWDMKGRIPLRPLPPAAAVTDAGVLKYLENREWQYVSRPSLTRASRILQQIRAEATRRGWTTLMRGDAGHGASDLPKLFHMQVIPPHAKISVRIKEVSAPGSRRLTREESLNTKTPSWMLNRQFTFEATGLLELSWGASTLREERPGNLEELIPRAFRDAEVDSLLWDRKQAENSRLNNLAQDHMERLQEIVGAATAGKRQWKEFEERFQAWRDLSNMRSFMDALNKAGKAMQGERATAHESWLRLVSDRLASMEALAASAPAPNAGLATREEVYTYLQNSD